MSLNYLRNAKIVRHFQCFWIFQFHAHVDLPLIYGDARQLTPDNCSLRDKTGVMVRRSGGIRQILLPAVCTIVQILDD